MIIEKVAKESNVSLHAFSVTTDGKALLSSFEEPLDIFYYYCDIFKGVAASPLNR